MKYNFVSGRKSPEKHHRRSIRIPHFDYSQTGWYFITICAQNRECLFGDVVNGKMALNKMGKIIFDEWIKSAEMRQEIRLDEFIIMPNHLHGIIIINDHGRGDRPVAPTLPVAPTKPDDKILPKGPYPKSIGSLIAGFKSAVTKQINLIRQTPRARVWQRNYWEHVIRDEKDLNRIREYIINNPINWNQDKYFG